MSLTVYFDRIVFNADEVFSKDKKNISTVHELCTSQMVNIHLCMIDVDIVTKQY